MPAGIKRSRFENFELWFINHFVRCYVECLLFSSTFSQPSWMQVRGSVLSFSANLPVALLGFPRGIAN